MIILLAMRNSLAARENTLRGPSRPPDCAARGVYAGDEGIRKRGGRRRIGKAFKRHRAAVQPPGSPCGGRRVADLPSGHRQPENKASFSRRHSSSAAGRQCHDSIRAALPACVWQVDSWLPLVVSPRGRSPGHQKWQAIRRVDNPHSLIRATRRPSHDGPGKRLAQPMSEPAARTRSEFVTHHK